MERETCSLLVKFLDKWKGFSNAFGVAGKDPVSFLSGVRVALLRNP